MSDNNDFDLSEFDNLEPFDSFDEGDDDDILDEYEDENDDAEESIDSLSEDEIGRRIDKYQADTKKYMQMAVKPKDFSKSQRLEAVKWLGESGNHEAIPALVKVYRKDKTAGMKEAAAFALGQLKAYKMQEEDPETQDEAIDRLNNVIIFEKRGRDANAMPFILGEIVLVIVAIVLFGFGGVLTLQNANVQATNVSNTQTAMPTPTQDTEIALQTDLSNYYNALVADANFYQEQLASATRGEGIACDPSLVNNDPTYTLSSTWQGNGGYVSGVNQLNLAQGQLVTVANAYRAACNRGVAMPREEALDLGSTVINIQRALAEIRTSLVNAGVPLEEQVFATSTPVPTATLDPSIPTPTRDTAGFDRALTTMRFIISDMIGTRGVAAQNAFNWDQMVTNGELYLSGCNQPNPTIPEDFSLAPELQGVDPTLDSAVSNLNIGLQSVRLSVDAFYTACSEGAVPEDVVGRSAQAQLGVAGIESAETDLNAFEGQ